MQTTDIKNPVWENLVLNKKQVNLNFLAGKILLSRCQLSVSRDPSPEVIGKAVKEIFDLYFQNKDLPNAKKDLELLLN